VVRLTILSLSRGEIKEIEEFANKAKSSREYRRAQAVLCKSKGMSATKIAEALGVHWRTVQTWIANYSERGMVSFKDRSRSGRPPKLTKEAKRKLLSAALKSPRLFGFLKNNWSLEMLGLYLKRETGVDISKSHIQRLLRKHGIVYKRPKLVAPEKRGKRAKKVENYKRVARALRKKG